MLHHGENSIETSSLMGGSGSGLAGGGPEEFESRMIRMIPRDASVR